MATIRSVASAAEVSIATVSRVLNEAEGVSGDVRQRVLRVAHRMGYSGTRRPASTYVALAYTGRCSIGSPYDVALLEGISAAAEEGGFDLAIVKLQSERKAGESPVDVMARKGIRGALLRTHAQTRQVCLELAKEGFPGVVIGDRFEEPDVSYIDADSRGSSLQAMEHLISLGHRRIAIATGHVPDNDHMDRLAAYEEAHRKHGIELDPKLVHHVWALRPNGEQVMRTVMSMTDRPTAIFITDPLVAVGAINQAHEMGVKIPGDISIVGFDDTDTRDNIYPKMSAVCQDAKLVGYEAMSLLTKRLAGEAGEVGTHKKLPTWLELHATTGCPPAVPARVLTDGTRIA